jgi:hypothetical protein
MVMHPAKAASPLLYVGFVLASPGAAMASIQTHGLKKD